MREPRERARAVLLRLSGREQLQKAEDAAGLVHLHARALVHRDLIESGEIPPRDDGAAPLSAEEALRVPAVAAAIASRAHRAKRRAAASRRSRVPPGTRRATLS